MTRYPFTFFGIHEPTPGPRWKALFDSTWPAYRAFYLRDGRGARPSLRTLLTRTALRICNRKPDRPHHHDGNQ